MVASSKDNDASQTVTEESVSSSANSSSSQSSKRPAKRSRTSDFPASTTSNSQSASNTTDTAEEVVAIERPRKLVAKRKFPLRTKCHDPAQCTDILDDMYQIYYDLEVPTPCFSFVIHLPTLLIRILISYFSQNLGKIYSKTVHGNNSKRYKSQNEIYFSRLACGGSS